MCSHNFTEEAPRFHKHQKSVKVMKARARACAHQSVIPFTQEALPKSRPSEELAISTAGDELECKADSSINSV